MGVQMLVVLFVLAVALIVAWAIAVSVRAYRRWRAVERQLERKIHAMRRDQHLLAEGLVPEFAVCDDCDDVMRRYLAGEDIPLRWRHPS